MSQRIGLAVVGLLATWTLTAAAPPDDAPRALDPRLTVERFAAAPDIVHPVALDFDTRGRMLVVESHTHFRPEGYKGPPHDRVRLLADTDGDGKADRFTTFFEGTRFTMDIAGHPDGSVYLATRNEILRLRDGDGDGAAEQRERIVYLDTKGDYPHNGLSGLCFDARGDLTFGMGENLGVAYKLIGSDGKTHAGGGEGGNVFRCKADGRDLRRMATGFWNPFGICRDIFGRLFAVDNDPDAMPPCRLLHVVEGGDYGYQFRYGRSGRHPFQAWDGQLPGTLPMVAGTGEAPCEVLAYESDGLPREYLGSLLVTAWADHRIERYVVKERGASIAAERKPFVQGGADFRPAGMAVAPDGTLFLTDWVLRDYNLHGRGAVWHVKPKQPLKPDRPTDPQQALASLHRPLRESAARQLGSARLLSGIRDLELRTRTAALTTLIVNGDRPTDLIAPAFIDPVDGVRALAASGLPANDPNARRLLDAHHPAVVRQQAIAFLQQSSDIPALLGLLTDADPFLRHAAVRQLAHHPNLLAQAGFRERADPRQRIGLLLAHRMSGRPEASRLVADALADPDENVRFLAVKWIADEKLDAYRPQVTAALDEPKLGVRQFTALATALARFDGKEVSDAALADQFVQRLGDARTPPAMQVRALQLVPSAHKKLTLDLLERLLRQDDPALRLEAVRTLAEHPRRERVRLLAELMRDPRQNATIRAEAIVGLAGQATEFADEFLTLTRDPALRDEALRALTGTKLTAAQQATLADVAKQPATAELSSRLLGRSVAAGRPPGTDLDAWLQRLDGPADAAAGRRVFFHPKLANCARCHRVDGRGHDIGPDLSDAARAGRRHVLEALLQPSKLVAPHYQAWHVETADGKVRTGLLVHTNLDESTYLDAQGERFKVNTRDVTETRPVSASIMPDGLPDLLTDQELRDLLAYLLREPKR